MERRYSQPALKKQKVQGLLIDWMFRGQGLGKVKKNFQVLSLAVYNTIYGGRLGSKVCSGWEDYFL